MGGEAKFLNFYRRNSRVEMLHDKLISLLLSIVYINKVSLYSRLIIKTFHYIHYENNLYI